MYLFYIIPTYYFDEIIKVVKSMYEEILERINSVKNKNMFNKRRLSGSKGRWQNAISVMPSRAGPLARQYI